MVNKFEANRSLQNLILQIQKIGLSIAKSKYFSCVKVNAFYSTL